jgi:hypothetical protein
MFYTNFFFDALRRVARRGYIEAGAGGNSFPLGSPRRKPILKVWGSKVGLLELATDPSRGIQSNWQGISAE